MLGQVSFGVFVCATALGGLIVAANGQWIGLGIVAVGAFYAYKTGWSWAHDIWISEGRLHWRAPFAGGNVALDAVSDVAWRRLPFLLRDNVVVIRVQGGRKIRVWFDRAIPGFFTAHSIPISKSLRTW